MSLLDKLMMKKKEQGRMMSPLEQKAKMGNLEALRDEMSSMIKGDLKPLGAKVEVSADDEDGLKDGLDKAKDILSKSSDMDSDSDSDSEDGDEDSEVPEASEMIGDSIKHEGAEGELSPEEIDQLQMLLSKLKQSKM